MKTTAEVWIPLTQGKVTVIDFDDFEKVRNFKWQADTSSGVAYAKRGIWNGKNNSIVKMHRELMQPEAGVEIDHIDGDGLNNRRSNLRLATHQQNARGKQRKQKGTTSNFRGVSWCEERRKWVAQINLDGQQTSLGRYFSEIDAAKAYDAAARKYFGEYAAPNFPVEEVK